MTDEQRARQRLTYWQHRLDESRAGRDSQDEAFVYLALRLRDFWAGRVTQLELERAA